MDHLHDVFGSSRWGRGHRGLGFARLLARRCPVRFLTYLPVDRFPVPIAEHVKEHHLTCLLLINCLFLSLITYQDVNEVLQGHYGRELSEMLPGNRPAHVQLPRKIQGGIQVGKWNKLILPSITRAAACQNSDNTVDAVHPTWACLNNEHVR